MVSLYRLLKPKFLVYYSFNPRSPQWKPTKPFEFFTPFHGKNQAEIWSILNSELFAWHAGNLNPTPMKRLPD